MSKVESNYLLKRHTISGMARRKAHPPSSSFEPSCSCLDTHVGHSAVVGWVLGALIVVALQGLAKDVVSDMKFKKRKKRTFFWG